MIIFHWMQALTVVLKSLRLMVTGNGKPYGRIAYTAFFYTQKQSAKKIPGGTSCQYHIQLIHLDV